MGYTYDQAMQMAQDVLDEAERVNAENINTNERLDNIIASSGTSSTEVVDARGNYTVLKDRLDESDSQLAQTETQLINTVGYGVDENGAVGDGQTNDTNAIQTLIDLVSANGGGTIVFSAKTYIVDGLKLYDNTRLVGMGYNSVVKLKNNASTPTPVIMNNDKVNGNVNISIENLRVHGNRENIWVDAIKGQGQPWEGINFVEVDNFSIRNVWIEDCENEGLDFDGGNNILVDTLYVKNCGGCALHPSTGQGDLENSNVIIRNIYSYNNGHAHQRGAVFLFGSNRLFFDGYFSENDYWGLQLSGNNMNITNVQIKSPTYRGLTFSVSTTDVNLRECLIEDSGDAGVYFDGSSTVRNSTLSNITVKNSNGYNYRIAGSKVTLKDSYSLGTTHIGIGLLGGIDSAIINCHVENSASYGISLNNSSGAKLIDNIVIDNETRGITLATSDNCIIVGNKSGNTGTNTGQAYGLAFSGTTGHVISNNDLSNNTTSPKLGSVEGSVFESNKGEGLTKQRGTVTASSGGQSVIVTHNMGGTPAFISLTPMNDISQQYWVSNRTSTQFTIIFSAPLDGDKTILWMAE